MPGKLSYERYHWFHGQIKAGRWPNARKMAEVFGISRKQAQRDIEFVRDRLGAPLRYSPMERGYGYEDTGFELPPVWFGEEDLLAFCLALRLSAAIPDMKFKDSLNRLLEKFIAFRSLSAANLHDVKEKVSVKNIQYYRVREDIFHWVAGALFQNRPLRITNHTPHKEETTERVVFPLHLLCYMGSWHLIAYCTLRRGLRDFALSRIRKAGAVSEKVDMPRVPSIKDYIRANFGLIGGEDSIEVRLRFTPEVSEWISEQVWHSAQRVDVEADGRLTLRFPVSDFREIRREILKFGSAVEVLAPKRLRKEVRDEIKKMGAVYR